MKTIEGGICAVKGVQAYGIKEGKMGLAIILAKGPAAAVFTLNKVRAAPVKVTKHHIATNGGDFNGIIANSGCANAFTHEQGINDAIAMAGLLAKKLGVSPHSIAVASTGVIGRPMNMDWINGHFEAVFSHLGSGPEYSLAANKAIMTTDLVPKSYAVEIDGGIRIGAIAKGSGMIEPNMGTMLSFVFTDAEMPRETLQKCLKKAVDKSYNMVVVDGDTSTNDTVTLIATGKAGKPDMKKFQEGLEKVYHGDREADREGRRRRHETHRGHRRGREDRKGCAKGSKGRRALAALQERGIRDRPELGQGRVRSRLLVVRDGHG